MEVERSRVVNMAVIMFQDVKTGKKIHTGWEDDVVLDNVPICLKGRKYDFKWEEFDRVKVLKRFKNEEECKAYKKNEKKKSK